MNNVNNLWKLGQNFSDHAKMINRHFSGSVEGKLFEILYLLRWRLRKDPSLKWGLLAV
jgi:hypothetical protein